MQLVHIVCVHMAKIPTLCACTHHQVVMAILTYVIHLVNRELCQVAVLTIKTCSNEERQHPSYCVRSGSHFQNYSQIYQSACPSETSTYNHRETVSVPQNSVSKIDKVHKGKVKHHFKVNMYALRNPLRVTFMFLETLAEEEKSHSISLMPY